MAHQEHQSQNYEHQESISRNERFKTLKETETFSHQLSGATERKALKEEIATNDDRRITINESWVQAADEYPASIGEISYADLESLESKLQNPNLNHNDDLTKTEKAIMISLAGGLAAGGIGYGLTKAFNNRSNLVSHVLEEVLVPTSQFPTTPGQIPSGPIISQLPTKAPTSIPQNGLTNLGNIKGSPGLYPDLPDPNIGTVKKSLGKVLGEAAKTAAPFVAGAGAVILLGSVIKKIRTEKNQRVRAYAESNGLSFDQAKAQYKDVKKVKRINKRFGKTSTADTSLSTYDEVLASQDPKAYRKALKAEKKSFIEQHGRKAWRERKRAAKNGEVDYVAFDQSKIDGSYGLNNVKSSSKTNVNVSGDRARLKAKQKTSLANNNFEYSNSDKLKYKNNGETEKLKYVGKEKYQDEDVKLKNKNKLKYKRKVNDGSFESDSSYVINKKESKESKSKNLKNSRDHYFIAKYVRRDPKYQNTFDKESHFDQIASAQGSGKVSGEVFAPTRERGLTAAEKKLIPTAYFLARMNNLLVAAKANQDHPNIEVDGDIYRIKNPNTSRDGKYSIESTTVEITMNNGRPKIKIIEDLERKMVAKLAFGDKKITTLDAQGGDIANMKYHENLPWANANGESDQKAKFRINDTFELGDQKVDGYDFATQMLAQVEDHFQTSLRSA